jgi:hypothetical protein
MLAFFLLISAQTGADETRLHKRVEAAPQPVATFIARRTSCNHWDGEVFGDHSERERLVQAQRKKLHCDAVQRDEQALLLKYRKHPEVVQLLADTRDLAPW